MINRHLCVLFLSLLLVFELAYTQANITKTRFLKDPETIQSSNSIFKAGFFSPTNSTNRYVGIWYVDGESDRLEVVWVANRENPVTDSSGVLKISEDGNLQLLNGKNRVIWSSNVPNLGNNSVAQVLDTGNLVLYSSTVDNTIIWQSFEHPTDSFLPSMKLTVEHNSSNKIVLFRSWKNSGDPSRGNFTIGMNTHIPTQIFEWNNDQPYWRNGAWNGNIFIGVESVISILNDNEGSIYLGYSVGNNKSSLQYFVVNYDGSVVQKIWNVGTKKWEIVWRARDSECDEYGKCGNFGICNSKNSPVCSCLIGFVPKNNEEWSKGNWTNGCGRRTLLQCETKVGRSDEFLKLTNLKIPDHPQWSSTNGEDECMSVCSANCSCLAYTVYPSIGCMIWNHDLIDTDEMLNNTGIDLSIRLAYSELGETTQQQGSAKGKARKRNIIIAVVSITGVITIVIMYCVWRWMNQRYGVTRVTRKKRVMQTSMDKNGTSKIEFGDLPIFDFQTLQIATDDFQDGNKLGRGGFGMVYKGRLEDGQEIAVKRLSKASRQGLQEFMNEVLVISKLQHRNLVKLLGCCVDNDEKMLVYEYMPNKSLDAFLFDPTHQKNLDWKKRLNIILGICRGLLYLHRDSRLRIIHRDLKASNILLDSNLNSKISDFGMARIFGGNQDQDDTKRIVGTYGYMSPEYAMEGRFSEKSDVFSFGVLLLEIVSGRRNSSFKDEESMSLLGHAWKLWNEGNIVALIDPEISDTTYQGEILRCIHLGILCVQEIPEERPSVSMVISMIENEVTDLPRPTQPAFAQRRIDPRDESQQTSHEVSVNQASITLISAR